MWRRPALSVAILTHARSAFLMEALEAFLGQTWGDFELIVLDNASPDDTAERVLAIKDPRLMYVRQPPGKLSGYNWATAVWMARGDLMLVTHDDDVAEPDLLVRAAGAFQRDPGLAAVATNVSIMDQGGQPLQARLYPWAADRDFPRGELLPAFLAEKLWVPMQTCLFRREIMARKVGLARRWSPAKRLATLATGDILNALQLNLEGGFRILEAPLLRYRQHGAQEGRGVHPTRHMIDLFRILQGAARRQPLVGAHLPLIEARLARYRAQDLLLDTVRRPTPAALARKGAAILDPLRGRAFPGPAAELLVPLDILARLLGLPSLEAGGAAPPALRADQAFAAWRARLAEGGTLLGGPGPRRIAILGSLLVAALLVLDARASGVACAAVLDSSPSRQGRDLLGLPVLDPAWLGGEGEGLDAILISSEGDHEAGIRELLRRHLGGRPVPILSWKDLALDPGAGGGAR